MVSEHATICWLGPEAGAISSAGCLTRWWSLWSGRDSLEKYRALDGSRAFALPLANGSVLVAIGLGRLVAAAECRCKIEVDDVVPSMEEEGTDDSDFGYSSSRDVSRGWWQG